LGNLPSPGKSPSAVEFEQLPGVPPLTCTCMQVQVSLRDAREGVGGRLAPAGRGSRPERGGGDS